MTDFIGLGFVVIMLCVVSLQVWRTRTRAPQYIGRAVLEIDCRGCMAETKVLRRIGEIVRIEYRAIPGAYEPQPFAICRDRDKLEDEFAVCMADSCFQQIPGGTGFIWER